MTAITAFHDAIASLPAELRSAAWECIERGTATKIHATAGLVVDVDLLRTAAQTRLHEQRARAAGQIRAADCSSESGLRFVGMPAK